MKLVFQIAAGIVLAFIIISLARAIFLKVALDRMNDNSKEKTSQIEREMYVQELEV